MKNMKRTLSNVAVAGVMTLGLMFAANPVWAQTSGTDGNIGGTIPSIRSIAVLHSGAEMTDTFFSTIALADYVTGYQESAADATVVTVSANDAWEVTVQAGLTGDFFTTSPVSLNATPRAANEKPLADLTLKVSGINQGTDAAADAPTIDGAWAAFTPLTFLAQDLVTGATGNEAAFWNLQYQMVLDSEDVPGAYSVDILYTIQAIAD